MIQIIKHGIALIILFLFTSSTSQSLAQIVPLAGTVESEKGQPIPKVKVVTYVPLEKRTKLSDKSKLPRWLEVG
jgi:hypothetical protein